MAILLGQTKFPFPLALLALLCLFHPRSLLRRTTPTSLVALAAASLSATLWAFASGSLTTATRSDVASLPLQMAFIREHPVRFVEVCAYTFRISAIEYGRQIVGVLGWLQIRLPQWLYAGMWVALALSTGFQGTKEREKLTPAMRVSCVLLAATMLLSVYVALYEMWNPVGAPVIDGVQGRYFILIVPLLAIACFHSLWLHLQITGPVRIGIYAIAFVVNGCALFTQFRAAF